MPIVALILLVFVAGCTHAATPETTLDEMARAYVRLVLEIGAHEDGYIDAYFGPPEWQDEANAAPATTAELKSEADRIRDALNSVERAALSPDDQHRVDWLIANVASARFRIEMIEGMRLPFREEAERLFALIPELRPLQNYDPVLARIELLLPGDAPLSERVEEFRARYTISEDRLQPVMDAAIGECRRRTLEHLGLPADEQFNMEFVTGQNWSAYNWYQGDHQSLIQINTELPIRIDDALRLGCHEGYPGHHLQKSAASRLSTSRKLSCTIIHPRHQILWQSQNLICAAVASTNEVRGGEIIRSALKQYSCG